MRVLLLAFAIVGLLVAPSSGVPGQLPTCYTYGTQPAGFWPDYLLVQVIGPEPAPVERMSIERARTLAEQEDRDTDYRTLAVCE